MSLTSPRLRTPYRNQSSGLLPEGGEIELILLEITEDEMLCTHLSHRVIVHLVEGVHWVVVNPFLLLLLLPLRPLPDVRIILECSLCMKSDKAHLLKQTRARQMRRASRRTEQVTPMHPLPEATYTGVRRTILGNMFFPSFLAKTKREQLLPGHIHGKFWPQSLQFAL